MLQVLVKKTALKSFELWTGTTKQSSNHFSSLAQLKTHAGDWPPIEECNIVTLRMKILKEREANKERETILKELEN